MMNWVYDGLRKQVSKDKKVDRDATGNLDLSYITDRVVAMSYPADGLESTYRNYYKDVVSYLDKEHFNNFKVWNLSSRPYSPAQLSAFHDSVIEMGFLDHHAPSFVILLDIIRSVHMYLTPDPKVPGSERSVAVIHCLAGKGRTGTIIAAYLFYSCFSATPSYCIRYFASQRSVSGSGIQQPSQIRYVNYFATFLNLSNSVPPSSLMSFIHPKTTRTIILRRITFNPLPNYSHKKGIRPGIVIYPMLNHYLDSGNLPTIQSFADTPPIFNLVHKTSGTYTHYKPPLQELCIAIDVVVNGDILINVYHLAKHVGVYLENRVAFRYQFNTEFMFHEHQHKLEDGAGTFKVEVGKSELDQAWNDHRVDSKFKMILDFEVKNEVQSKRDQRVATNKDVEWKEGEVRDFVEEWNRMREEKAASGYVDPQFGEKGVDMERSWVEIGNEGLLVDEGNEKETDEEEFKII